MSEHISGTKQGVQTTITELSVARQKIQDALEKVGLHAFIGLVHVATKEYAELNKATMTDLDELIFKFTIVELDIATQIIKKYSERGHEGKW